MDANALINLRKKYALENNAMMKAQKSADKRGIILTEFQLKKIALRASSKGGFK